MVGRLVDHGGLHDLVGEGLLLLVPSGPEIAHNGKRVEDVDGSRMKAFLAPIGAYVSSPSRMILVERLPNDCPVLPAIIQRLYAVHPSPASITPTPMIMTTTGAVDVRMRLARRRQLDYQNHVAGAEDDKAEIGRELVEQSGPDARVPAGVVALPRYGEISRLGMSRSGRIAQAWRLLSVVGLRVG